MNNTAYQVVGIFKPTGSRTDDASIYMPLTTMRKDFGEKEKVSGILAEVQPGKDPATVASAVSKNLRTRRGEKTGEETFTVSTSQQLMDSFNQLFLVVQAIIIGLAGISLIVGGIGIMKAVGARNSDILMIFLVESGMLGVVGGALGVAAGFLISKLVEVVARNALGTDLFVAYFPPELAAAAILFSFTIGAASGALPALNASRLKPVDALRYE